jgi:hypothetical protein
MNYRDASNRQSSPSQKEKFSYISAINVDVDFNSLDHNRAIKAVIPPAIATKPTTPFKLI